MSRLQRVAPIMDAGGYASYRASTQPFPRPDLERMLPPSRLALSFEDPGRSMRPVSTFRVVAYGALSRTRPSEAA
jgi:hypothetical protein